MSHEPMQIGKKATVQVSMVMEYTVEVEMPVDGDPGEQADFELFALERFFQIRRNPRFPALSVGVAVFRVLPVDHEEVDFNVASGTLSDVIPIEIEFTDTESHLSHTSHRHFRSPILCSVEHDLVIARAHVDAHLIFECFETHCTHGTYYLS